VRRRVPGIQKALAAQVVDVVQRIRALDLKKLPSIAETLDWARALTLLNADLLTPQLLTQTLNVLLKYEGDVQRVREQAREIVQA